MRVTGTFVIAAAMVGSVMGGLFGNKVVSMCRKGKTSEIRGASCDQLGKKGMFKCLDVPNHDHTLAAIIRRCPSLLPQGSELEDALKKLYVNKLPLAFHALLAEGRCARISPDKLQELLTDISNNDSLDMARGLMFECVLPESMMKQFRRQLQALGRAQLWEVIKNTPHSAAAMAAFGLAGNSAGAYVQGSSPSAAAIPPVTPVQVQSGAKIKGGNSRASSQTKQSTSPFSASAGGASFFNSSFGMRGGVTPTLVPYRGDPLKATLEEVQSNINILAQLNPIQARRFGLLCDACMGLTEAHFKQPGVSSLVVANLPLSCFTKIPPQAFAGFNARMVAKIRWWPFVSRYQIKYLPAGDVIRALPFDQLGPGRQKDKEDRIHPCWTITHDQLRSIRKSSHVKREYDRRCVRSAAPTLNTPLALMGVSLCAAVVAAIAV